MLILRLKIQFNITSHFGVIVLLNKAHKNGRQIEWYVHIEYFVYKMCFFECIRVMRASIVAFIFYKPWVIKIAHP